jgi:hypothetical protein
MTRTKAIACGRRLLLTATLLVVAIGCGGVSPAAGASVFTCTGFVGQETIRANVVVPDGAFCFFLGSDVRGGVTVEAGGSLRAEQAEFRGDITSEGHYQFLVNDGVVRGSIFATGGTGYTAVSGPVVRGNVTLVDNGGESVGVFQTTVRGSVTVNDNVVDTSPLIAENDIRVDLACTDNLPAPSTQTFLPSAVGGTKSGQCAGL